ncbi:MAG: hypothetical protein ACXWC9_01000 [Pseudobdellovibrionaceae bacterium]
MKWTFAAALIFSIPAFAHIEKGEHQGTTESGETCSMIAGDASFLNNVAHPLNERIEIQIGADSFTIGHPPVVDAAKSIAYFNHDIFQGVLATSTGAKALVIEMIHTETKEGPASYSLITHNWKTNVSTKVVCSGLTFTK